MKYGGEGRERQKKTGGIKKKKWGWNFKWKDKRGERASGKGVGRKGGLRVISLKVPMKGARGKCREKNRGMKDVIRVLGEQPPKIFFFKNCVFSMVS